MVYLLLGTGFEETEAIAPLDLLRRAGIRVMTVGLNGKTVYGGHGIGVEADITIGEMDLTAMDMIILPGGLGGVASIRASREAMMPSILRGITANLWQLFAQALRFWQIWAL
jgi:4-methyl-5(b-hydroxyethyl)-thiazole monophosphate biosynthesis